MQKRIIKTALILLFVSLILQSAQPQKLPAAGREIAAQSFSDPDLRDFLEDQKKEFAEFNDNIARELQDFKDDADREFSKFLKDAWEEFGLAEPVQVINKPKPTTPPVFTAAPTKGTKPKEPLKIVINQPVPPPPTAPEVKPPVKSIPEPKQAVVLPQPTPDAVGKHRPRADVVAE